MARSHGLKAWLIQRLSAVYMALYLVIVLLSLALSPPADYPQWTQFIAAPAMSVATLLFFLMLLLHAWVGVRDVVMDYVPHYALRLSILVLVAGGLLTMAVWALQVIAGTW